MLDATAGSNSDWLVLLGKVQVEVPQIPEGIIRVWQQKGTKPGGPKRRRLYFRQFPPYDRDRDLHLPLIMSASNAPGHKSVRFGDSHDEETKDLPASAQSY